MAENMLIFSSVYQGFDSAVRQPLYGFQDNMTLSTGAYFILKTVHTASSMDPAFKIGSVSESILFKAG